MIEIDKITEEEKKLMQKCYLQIHDELVFESSIKDQKNNEKLIKKVMTSVSSSRSSYVFNSIGSKYKFRI